MGPTEHKPIDSLMYSYRCPSCGREGGYMTFVKWQAEDLENARCTCGHEGPTLDFRKPTREILALARGRVLGAIEALSVGLGIVDTLAREIRPVFDPTGSTLAEWIKTRVGDGRGTDILDLLGILADLIKVRLQNLED